MKLRYSLLIMMLVVSLTACSTNDAQSSDNNQDDEPIELFVSAAASLTDAMDDIKEMYEEENNVELTFNLAGSGKLAQQIEQGAPVDVFISANEHWLDYLIDEELVIPETREDVTGNKLVLIANKDSDYTYDSFEAINTDELSNIAIGTPESVPAGEYTKSVLTELGTWDEIEAKTVFAQDVRQVLTYVETGNADIGFVYESDVVTSDQVKVLAESDTSLHDAIIYPGGVTTDSEHTEAGEEFLEFMLTDEVQEVLATYGFSK